MKSYENRRDRYSAKPKGYVVKRKEYDYKQVGMTNILKNGDFKRKAVRFEPEIGII